MGLFGNGGNDDDVDDINRDDARDPYPQIEPDFRAPGLYDLEQTRGFLSAVFNSSKVNSDFGTVKIEDPKDRSYEAVQYTDDDEITDATAVWVRETEFLDKDLAGDHIPPEGKVWTHIYGREQATGEYFTEMYNFGFDSEGLSSSRVTRGLKALEDRVLDKVDSNMPVSSGSSSSGSTRSQGSKSALNEESPVGEAYDPEGYSWNDLGATDEKLTELKENLQYPLESSELFDFAGVGVDGVLLYGPPGTGKTLTTKIAASQADANVLQVSGADLFGELMGQSEENFQKLYDTAREISPSIILMDEIDQVTPSRGESVNSSVDRMVGQFLQELDGYDSNENVLTVGTTNRLEMVDDAFKRSGRLSNLIEMPKPALEARHDIFDIKTKEDPNGEGTLVESGLDYEWLARASDGLTGADIQEVLDTAAKRNISNVRSQVDDVANLDPAEFEDELRVSQQDLAQVLDDYKEEGDDDEDEGGDDGRLGFQ